MALHPDFPESPHEIIDPSVRWLPDQTLLLGMEYGMLLPPLVQKIREQVRTWRDSNYSDASETSKALLNWWFKTPHLREQTDGTMGEFQYYFAQREALETIIYLYDVVKVKDEVDMIRFDSSGAVSTGLFDENWRRFVIKMATGTGKTKVMSLAIAWSFFHKLYEQDSELSRNFLVIAPNIIVLDRLYHDFQGLRIFFEDPVLPDNGFEGHNWRNDFQLTTATPKHSNGAIFVQTVSDYPLVEAISQNIVKHPVLPDAESRAKLVERQSVKYTEKYVDYLNLGVIEWRKAYAEHEKLGKKAILFVMTDNTRNCDDVATYLENRYLDLKDAVLVIHTKQNGEISEATSGRNREELEKLRKQANAIDSSDSPYKAIVLGVDAQGGMGCQERYNHSRTPCLFRQNPTFCQNRLWGADCV